MAGRLPGDLPSGKSRTPMTLLSVKSFYQMLANGLLLLMAVVFDQDRRGSRDDL